MSKKNILPNKMSPGNLTNGDKSKNFKSYLDAIGINKEQMMEEFGNIPEKFSDIIKARFYALESYRVLADTAKQWYINSDGRMFTIMHELQQLEADIAMKRIELESEGVNPIDDKPLQLALRRKMELIALGHKMKLDKDKVNLDKKISNTVTENDVVW